MKVGVLFSGGKDSTYAAYLAKKNGYELSCLITIASENKSSYMFHTPSIAKTKKQAEFMEIPLIYLETKGEKEKELKQLKKAIKIAKRKYKIEGIVTGAVQSVYQSSRIQKICDKLKIECFNPLWQKKEEDYLNELIDEEFDIIITGVAAFPLDNWWLGRKIDFDFIKEIKELNKRYKISTIGEGGEFETFVVNCPLFKKKVVTVSYTDIKEGENSWRRDIR